MLFSGAKTSQDSRNVKRNKNLNWFRRAAASVPPLREKSGFVKYNACQ
jgi:hypothetical protein